MGNALENKVLQPEFVGDIVRQFLEIYEDNTIKYYKNFILEFFNDCYCDKCIKNTEEINLAMVEAVQLRQVENYMTNLLKRYRRKELKEGSIRLRQYALSSFFNYIARAYDYKYVKINYFLHPIIERIMARLPKKKNKAQGDTLEINELKDIIAKADKSSIKQDVLIIRMLCRGLRSEEVTLIKFCDFYKSNDSWFLKLEADITKGKDDRIIELTPSLMTALFEWFDESLFGKSNVRLFDIKPHRVNKIVKKYSSHIDKKITSHRLRHSMATYLAEHSKTDDLMDFFGWKDVETARLYTRHVNAHKNNIGKLIPEGI